MAQFAFLGNWKFLFFFFLESAWTQTQTRSPHTRRLGTQNEILAVSQSTKRLGL